LELAEIVPIYPPISSDRSQPLHGQRLDATGLYYYNARYYDPMIGRFISPDIIVQSPANPQTLNRYSYCLNNPLKYRDPSGHLDGTDWGQAQNGVWAAILWGCLGYTGLTLWGQYATDALNAAVTAWEYSPYNPKNFIPIPEWDFPAPTSSNMFPNGFPNDP
jgi:RHS repeat-associated protein